MAKLPSHRNGFTLIGVLVAMIILTSTFVVFSRFIAARDQSVLLGRQTLVAASLAREGLELVRAVRDTNHFTDPHAQDWLAGVCGHSDQFLIDAATVRDSLPLTFSTNGQLWRTPRGEWTNNADGNTATEYSRVMGVDCAAVNDDPAFAIITSTVSWTYQGGVHNVVLKEKLFNWLPLPPPS